MTKPRIAIILSSTREGRFADTPAQWIKARAEARGDADYEMLDPRDFPLPFLGAKSDEAGKQAIARWKEKMEAADGYIFVTAEYNHSITGWLKNALDYGYGAHARKPAAFLGYGGVGGARAVQQLRQIAVELQIAPLRNAVHIGMAEMQALSKGERSFADFAYLGDSADKMLDDLGWWVRALRTAREAAANAIAAE